jgi:DNA-binding response OmpR family regulator
MALLESRMPNKILIVDDFKEYAGLLEKKLKAEGFQTVVLNDSSQAVERASAEKPDLILLDIMMPNIGGTELRVELMKNDATKDIPIIFLTGLRAPHHTKKPSPAGVKVVGKSEDIGELLGAVREALGKTVKK